MATTAPHSLEDVRPTKLVFPDLISPCPFPLRMNPHCKRASASSKKWLLSGCRLSKKKRAAFHGLKGGLLTAMCYPRAPYTQMRVCCDFINYLFHLDNICDEMDDNRTVSTAGEVLGALRDPHNFRPSSAVGRLTKRYVRYPRVATCARRRAYVTVRAAPSTAFGAG